MKPIDYVATWVAEINIGSLTLYDIYWKTYRQVWQKCKRVLDLEGQ